MIVNDETTSIGAMTGMSNALSNAQIETLICPARGEYVAETETGS